MSSIDKAVSFYEEHIYDTEKIRLLNEHNLKTAGFVPSILWELFGSILTGKGGAGTTGADLHGWEVKSCVSTGSYEYQYHLNTGKQKLKEDCEVNHLFCSYTSDYRDVVVRAMPGPALVPKYFDIWLPLYLKNYDITVPKEQRRQRFRKSIARGFVKDNACILLEIKGSKMVFKNEPYLKELNKLVSV